MDQGVGIPNGYFIINAMTFALSLISMRYHRDYDGASNELVAALIFDWDRSMSKKRRRMLLPFRLARIVAELGLITTIILIIGKPTWIIAIIEVWMIIQTSVILINCLTQVDHNFSNYEQYWITTVAFFLVMQRFPLGLFSNDIVMWQKNLSEGLNVAVQSALWLIQIFMWFISALLAFNGFCKKVKKIKRIDYARFSWNVSDWYVKRVGENKHQKCLLPVIVITDAIFYMLKKAIVFLAAMFNELLPSINDFIQKQVDTLDTQLIRLAFRSAIVCSLSMMYGYMELKGIYAESTINIFSYVATVIVVPIVLEGILGLRERIKDQARIEKRKDSLEDVLQEAGLVKMEQENE